MSAQCHEKCGILGLGNSHLKSKSFLILSIALLIVFLIPSKICDALVLIVSQFCHNAMPAATSPAIAATTKAIGPSATPDSAPPTTPTADTTLPIVEISVPMIISTGPIAATTRPIVAMVCFWESSRLLNQSTAPWMASATLRITGARASPREVTATSREDFSFSREPPNPLIMAVAISVVVPSASRLALNVATSPGAVLISANHLAMWFLPKITLAASSCCASVSVAKESWSSCWTRARSFIWPCSSVREIPSLSIMFAASSAGDTRREKPVFKAVAASLAAIPLFAITPIMSAASSTV